jgi:hypothetical protein
MSAANKILTVSYGTFSCTIEGFEDPFGTMKQIAEYFRDLAAEDRYFGAEPPVPDAEALRHIAERETARRVEARMASGAVHLRRLDDAAAAAAATPVAPAATPSAPPVVQPEARAVLTPSEVIDPAPASVAERLSRIRAVVARARTQPLWPDEDAVVPTVTEAPSDVFAAASVAVAGVAAASVATAATPAPAPIAPEASSEPSTVGPDAPPVRTDAGWTSAFDAEAASAPSIAEVSAASDDLPADETAIDDTPTAVAAAEMPAAGPEAGPDVAEAIDLVEDGAGTHAGTTPTPGKPEPGEPARSLDDVVSDWEIPVAATTEYVRPELPIARVAVLRKDDHAAAAAMGQIEDLLSGRIGTEDLYDDEDDVAAPAATTAGDDSLLEAIRAVGAAAHEAGTEDADDAEDNSARTDASEESGIAWDEPALSDDPATAEDLRGDVPAGATLHLGAEWRADQTVQAAEAGPANTAHASERDVTGLLLDEEPSEETAADRDDFFDVDADDGAPLLLRAGDDTEQTGAPDARDVGPDDEPAARAGHEQAVEDLERRPEDASVDRLLAATNSQLESTEVNRRRSAIAHLKAAVAAARADRRTEDEDSEPAGDSGESALDKFREDLARVVRPRRPVDQDQPRPSRRLPPLMLVSEQRIDVGPAAGRNEDAVAGPVRPRRVVTREVGDDEVAGTAVAEQGGFADFAESMGARDLPDMIEAAAAYTAFVEGRPSFSRPQLMQMMRAGESADVGFSREEQLRSFGLLLRQGRIQKLKRGQFTVADDTRFRPPHRHAGE